MKSAEQILYRILQGRLLFKKHDLVLFVHEPSKQLLYDSFEIYDDVFEEAYMNGVYIEEEILELLINNNLWTPLEEREADKLDKEVENLKVDAFQNFFDTKQLNRIKREIKAKEKRGLEHRAKKHYFDHLTCEGVANFSRWNWLIAHSTFERGGELCDWGQVNLQEVMSFYDQNGITTEEYRYIARTDPWRSMWITGKRGGLFDAPSSSLNKDQLSLCMFSTMYDNVRENPEAPDEKIIEDNDCLDGWFIVQRRKFEQDKKGKNTEDLIKNPKIANSKEIFLMAPDRESAKNIYDLNDNLSKSIIIQREQTMQGKENIRDIEFFDVKQDIELKKNQAMIQHVRGQK